MRRDFIECAAGQVSLTGNGARDGSSRSRSLYRLNEARSGALRPRALSGRRQRSMRRRAALKEALDGLFAEAEQELAGLPDQAREGKALRSLVNHREGLCVFVDRPQVPLDNNLAERVLQRAGDRKTAVVRLRQRERRPVHGR